MKFTDLNLSSPLLNALEELGISEPTPIQERVYSVVMSGQNVCGIAQTGTGKTFAYLLPCLKQFVFSNDKNPQVIILVPTRELVVQVLEAISQLTTYMTVRAVGIYGGVNFKPQVAEVAAGVDFLVATPGRVIDLMNNGVIQTKRIKKLVIDEFDEMLQQGFKHQILQVLEKLPEKRQNLLFSATVDGDVKTLITNHFEPLAWVEAAAVGTPVDKIEQAYFEVPNFYTKINLLKRLLTHTAEMTKVLVFVSTKHLADLVFEELAEDFADQIDVIHSNKSQLYRFAAVEDFTKSASRALIATDLIARGIDVLNVSHVINLDVPETPQAYIHRIGRTGRVGQTGTAWSFITENEKEAFSDIQNFMNVSVKMLGMPEGLEISERKLKAEEPQIVMKTDFLRPKIREVGPAFHEKLDKNKKVNVRRDHEAEKKLKYGKSYEKRRRE